MNMLETKTNLDLAISTLHTTIKAHRLNKKKLTEEERLLLFCNIGQLSDTLKVVDEYLLKVQSALSEVE